MLTNRRTDREIKERDKVLKLADRLIRLELGNRWTLETHIARKAALLRELDGGIQ